MRELKFRAWDKKEKKWVGADFWYEEVGLNFNVQPPSTLTMSGKERYVIVQYTGLKDKAGNEIYEGDLLGGKYLNFGVSKGAVAEVKMGVINDTDGYSHGSTWGWVVGKESLLDLASGFEILGNIFENPEMIEVD